MGDIAARLSNGVLVMIIGMVIVFTCLVILVYLFKLMGFVVTRTQKKSEKTDAETGIQALEDLSSDTTAAAGDEDGDIAAAIAAVMCVLSGERRAGTGGLNVKPLRRVGPRAPKWGQN